MKKEQKSLIHIDGEIPKMEECAEGKLRGGFIAMNVSSSLSSGSNSECNTNCSGNNVCSGNKICYNNAICKDNGSCTGAPTEDTTSSSSGSKSPSSLSLMI